ncbi:casein kinase I, partial [Chytriomyces hyalinus]
MDSIQSETNKPLETSSTPVQIRMEQQRESTRKREEGVGGISGGDLAPSSSSPKRELVADPFTSKAEDGKEKGKSSASQNAQSPALAAVKNQTAPAQVGANGSSSKLNGSKSNLTSTNNNMIGTHFKVGKKIGEGSFGVIYEGLNILTNLPIAIKFEPRKSDAPQLRDEYKTYRLLANSLGIPQAYYFGQEGLHNVLCIDLLGPSLEDMFDLCHRKFSVKTACMVA